MKFLFDIACVMSAIAFGVSFIFCVVFCFVEGRWPIWHFKLFASWWWPFRKSSAATMLADTLIGEMHKDWKPWGCDNWKNTKLKAEISTFCDNIKAEINGEKIPMNQWDKYRIVEAIRLFKKRLVGKRKQESAQEVAEAIIKAYGGQK